MRVLVLAHGDGRRWENNGKPYLGAAKHFVRVDGETLLARAVRLFAAHGTEVVVVAPDDRYDIAGVSRVALADPWPVDCDMSKFLATRHLWAADRRTIIVWGDVFYTEAAVATIVGHTSDDYHVFRRPGASTVTGHRWDESFAVSFGQHEHDRVAEMAAMIADMHARGLIKRTHIRTHYAAMIGVAYRHGRDVDAIRAVRATPHQTHIDDFTDDIDTPAEWLEFVSRYTAAEHAAGRRRIVKSAK